ncbi:MULTISPECIES: hypothetical protein [Mycolicibacterium]|uniref:hypothetical protein n=1 Tax=Mycolicibacterium TaxID=1866885 RepID=UPI000A16B30F|nr:MULTISPECIES: hypothetical protein [Mycolicibacterium]
MTVDGAIAVETGEDAGEFEPRADEPKTNRIRPVLRATAARWRVVVVVALLVASASLATVLYLTQYRVDRQVGVAHVQQVIDAASTGTVALLSYAPETLDQDLATARESMTGDFLTYYGKFTSDVVAPAVRDKGIKATAQIVRVAMMEMHPDSAKVLVFLNQETVSRDRPDPALTASSVVVSLTKVDGSWLISAFDPV